MPPASVDIMKPPDIDVTALCFGTNRGPHTKPLRFAEKDAVEAAHMLTGAIGTATGATYLLSPTLSEARRAFADVARRAPSVFYFFDSGHGSPKGIVLGDGVLTFDELAGWVRRVNAPHSLVALDICHAGAYLQKEGALGDTIVGGVGLDYLDALANATEGNRVFCSVGADRLAAEGGGVRNGHFTASMFEALSLVRSRDGFVMDHDLFTMLARVSVSRFRQRPYASGLTNDLPIAYSQPRLIGSGAIVSTDKLAASLKVGALVTGRHGVPTRWRSTIANRAGRVLVESERHFLPTEDVFMANATFAVPSERIALDPMSQIPLLLRGATALVWHVSLEDMRGRVLDGFHEVLRWHVAA